MTNMYNKKPLFFLFTCIKDGRQYVSRLFDSLLNQSVFNFVHFIYEDGSVETIEDIVSGYKERAPYKVIYEKNQESIGLNLATIHCIKKCTQPFFIWIDCDNWVDEHFFEELEKQHLNNKKAVVLRSKRVLIREDGDVKTKNENIALYRNSIKAKKDYDCYILFDRYYYSFFAVDNEYYKSINPYYYVINDKAFFNDQQVLYMCAKNHKRFSYSEKAIGFCLVRGNSESSNNYMPVGSKFKFFESIDKHFHINKFVYDDCLKCLSLEKEHRDLFNKGDLVASHLLLMKKRNIFKRNNISNKALPFCDKSIFSLIYFLLPGLAQRLLVFIRKH